MASGIRLQYFGLMIQALIKTVQNQSNDSRNTMYVLARQVLKIAGISEMAYQIYIKFIGYPLGP